MYDYKNIRVELPEPGIAVMSFARPEKLNSWSRGAFEDLLDFFRRLKTDDDLKVVVLRGDGDRAFCTGADFVSLFPGEGERESPSKSYAFQEEVRELVISAVHGYAVGGGFFLTMASDIRIISDDVKFSCPLLKLNMSCGDLGGAYMLPRLIGDGVARHLLLTGRYMLAEEAMRLGYASQCVPRAQLDAAAMEKARLLAGYSRDAMLYSKELLNIMEGVSDLDTAIKIENRNQQLVKALKREAAAQ